ncbi:unnamed protein product [Bursaphelenchus xylophilus]|uniref:Vesicle transport protein n=1 Tax=Bursaphelenchus xylophilus TaxID=6326 RepID=A0A1I7SE85_BURXY|nr:unnamed protein product [Bursaphelenchus xylophilus]CAG9088653.1 unnamed protein product [Bursaphelenchus xylophilus]
MFDRLRSQSTSDVEVNGAQPAAGESQRVTDLSWELRVYCFIGCFILSMVCSLLGSPFIFAGKLTEFAVMVSLGSIISIGGTFFLSGPLNQLKKMFEPTRLVATLIYILMIILTLITGLLLRNGVLAVLCIIGQYLAMGWYSLSYIPYAREVLWSFFNRCF